MERNNIPRSRDELKPVTKKINIAICYATDEKYASLLRISLRNASKEKVNEVRCLKISGYPTV